MLTCRHGASMCVYATFVRRTFVAREATAQLWVGGWIDMGGCICVRLNATVDSCSTLDVA